MPAKIINPDDCKEKIEGYDPARAEDFHRESAKMADKEYEKTLKNSDCKEVIFLCGGSASGKTEFVDSYLKNFDAIILDSTFASN
jgi:polynucleotide 5'-kinase involved in rRNA processing